MRPYAKFSRFLRFLAPGDHGLPLSGGLDYNERQKLPHGSARCPGGHAVRNVPEAAMEAQRPERDQATTRAANGANAVAHETRAQKLARIRREIEAGTYETPDKLQAALERMMGVLVD